MGVVAVKKNMFAGLLCLAGLLLAGCEDLNKASAPSGNAVIGDAGWLIVREDGEDALYDAEDKNIIWRDSEPSRITFRVEGGEWDATGWRIDSDGETSGDGLSVTVDGRPLREGAHILVFTGVLRGVPRSVTVPFTVRGARTADVSWTETELNSSITEFDFDLGSWTGVGTRTETWKLTAFESYRVYFAVRKQVLQTIAVEGADALKVTQAEPGAVVDGSKATPDLAVFTVDAGDEWTLFSGGKRNFTLRVTEGDRDDKVIVVDLELRPHLTGAAIFAVDGNGGLDRITASNVDKYANALYREHAALLDGFPLWGVKIEDVRSLAGALKWLDSYAKSGTEDKLAEYLVRVEKNEVLNKTALTGVDNDASSHYIKLVHHIKVRLRGYGGERRITHNSKTKPGQAYYKAGQNIIMSDAFLSIGARYFFDSYITLQLEENITVDAAGGTDGYFPSVDMVNMIGIAHSCTFIMEAGSKLTNYRADGSSTRYAPVGIVNDGGITGYGNGIFEMRGGEISNCKNCIAAVYIVQGSGSAVGPGKFIYRGGDFNDNDPGGMIYVGGYGYRLYSDSYFWP
jgi:hypothetical protein